MLQQAKTSAKLWIAHALERFLAWLITKEEKKLATAAQAYIKFKTGAVVALQDVEKAISAVPLALTMVSQGKPGDEIEGAVIPLISSVTKEVAAILIPGGGIAAALVIWAIQNAHRMSFEEEQKWMERETPSPDIA